MASRQTEGDNRQRRAAAREARDAGMTPSEAGATTGASKQIRHERHSADHDEKIDSLRRGKMESAGGDGPDTRPGSGIPEQQPR